MTYALVTNGAIQSLGRLPSSARRLDTGQWVMGLAIAPVAMQQACGWFAVADTPRPADTATTTFDRSVELVDNTPTVVWTERAKTQAELDAEANTTNRATIEDRARTALATNRTFLGLSSPTNAQNAAQIKALTRQMNGVIRLLLGQLDGTD